jgi:sec-independent protein translocase protein TatC
MMVQNQDKLLDWKLIQERLEEVRWRFIRILIGLIVLSIAAFPFSGSVMNFLSRPFNNNLALYSITEAFWVRLKTSFFTALFLAIPFIFIELWSIGGTFLNPNPTYTVYKRYFIGIIMLATILFILGCSLSFLVVIPAGLQFLLSYGGEHIKPLISADRYFSFCLLMIMAFGISFQLPLILVLLSRIGIVNYHTLARNRHYAILVLTIAAAILTPTPDAYNMLLLAGPLVVLYEISVWLSWIFGKEKIIWNG